MTSRCHRPLLLPVALVLATAIALACAGVASAQQSEPPTELWQEYPLEPEPGTQEPAGGGSQGGEESGRVGTPADDGERGGAAAVPDGGSFPLLPVVVALALLLLLLPGLGLWAQQRGGSGSILPRRVRSRLSGVPVALGGVLDVPAAARSQSVRLWERIGAVGRPSLLERPWPRPSGRRLRAAFRDEGSDPRYPPAMARREQERGLAPEAPREPARAKPPKPQKPKPAAKKRVAEKPPPAKPAKPPKRSRSAKPATPAAGASATPKRPLSPPPPKPKPSSRKQPPREQGPAREPEPARELELARELEPAREPPPPVEEETLAEPTLACSIVWRRDGATSEFSAVSSGLRGHEFVVETSPEFEWLGGAVPPEAREAHAILVYTLIRDGWQPVAGEGPWYRQRFERPVEVVGSEPPDR